MLPWPEWGETDFILTQGLAAYMEKACPCGCGQWRDECCDADTAGRWQVEVDVCQAREAVAEFQRNHPDLSPGSLVRVRLLAEGEEPSDPLIFDPEKAAAEFEAMRQRTGMV